MTTTIRVTEAQYYQIQAQALHLCRTNGEVYDSTEFNKWLAEKYGFPVGVPYRIEVVANPKEKP